MIEGLRYVYGGYAVDSLALEIVGAEGTAKIGPTTDAPDIDEADVAHERLETLSLPQVRRHRPPDSSQDKGGTSLCLVLNIVEEAFRRARVRIDKGQLPFEIGQSRGRGGLVCGRMQHLQRGVDL